MKNRDAFYYLLIIIAVCCWGVSFVFTTGTFKLCDMTPIALIFFRLLIAAPLQIIVCSLFFRQRLRAVPRKDWLYILSLSLFEPFLYFIFETYSLKVTADATIVSVIIATIPIFTVFLSVFYFKENLSKLNIFGVIASVAGVIIMLAPKFGSSGANVLGILLAFGAVFTAVGYSFFLKKISDRYNPIFIVTCQNTIGLILLLPLMLILHSPTEVQTQFSYFNNPTVLLYVSLLAICCSAIAYTLYIVGLQRVGLGRANTFTNLIPVVTGIFAFFFINEPFPILKIIGALIVVAGVWCVQIKIEDTNNQSFKKINNK